MKKDTKQTIATLAKRTAFLFSVAFLIFSCNPDDDDNFDCEDLQANFGEACDSAGVISTNCECITTFIIDSGGVTVYDCTDLMLNYGDNCGNNAYIDSNCDCITVQDSTINDFFDCIDLLQNIGDSCWLNIQGANYAGVISMNCECYSETAPTFDCPDLAQNFGDSCWVINADSTYVGGIIDLNCECN